MRYTRASASGPAPHACTARTCKGALCERKRYGQVDPHRPACLSARAVVEVQGGDRPAAEDVQGRVQAAVVRDCTSLDSVTTHKRALTTPARCQQLHTLSKLWTQRVCFLAGQGEAR